MSVRPPIQPQAQPQGAPQIAPGQPPAQGGLQQPSGRQGQAYNPQIMKGLEQHLNTLPPQQQKYLSSFMTPELAVLFGIVIGQEAFDYFKKFVDPNKMLTVVPRPQGQGQPGPGGQSQQQGQPPQGQQPQQTQQP